MPTYLLAMHQPTGDRPAPEAFDAIMRDVRAVRDDMQAAGAWVFGGGLHGPETATVVRATDDDFLLTDGPFAEAKEQLGGITIVEAPDLDAALEWARRTAKASTLPIEVRPFQQGLGE